MTRRGDGRVPSAVANAANAANAAFAVSPEPYGVMSRAIGRACLAPAATPIAR